MRAGSGRKVSQGDVAQLLGVSVPSVSSWESGSAIPPVERLRVYAHAFCTERTFVDGKAALVALDDLNEQEERRRQRLIDELGTLRTSSLRVDEAAATPSTGQLGGRFWFFGDGKPVRIITTKMWPSVLSRIPYADRRHPNYIESFADADRDATIELFGHIRAENPQADVRFLTADRAAPEDLLGHVVVLGQGDDMLSDRAPSAEYEPSVLKWLARRLELPIGVRVSAGGDQDLDGEFVVTLGQDGQPVWYSSGLEPAADEAYPPRFLRRPGPSGLVRAEEDGIPLLEYDVALLARQPNPLNLAATVTLCSGVFSRGTYGAVRTLTDATLRVRNERFLERRFSDLREFWMLFYVPVYEGPSGLDTVTPDLERPFHQLRDSLPDVETRPGGADEPEEDE